MVPNSFISYYMYVKNNSFKIKKFDIHSYILTPYPKPFSLPAQYRWMTNNKDQRANYCLHPFELRTSFLLLNGPVAHTLAVFFYLAVTGHQTK